MKQTVSIIIPVYNGEEYLERCLNSVRKQTYNDIEIIIINDGSTDQTEEICKNVSNSDPRIRCIKQENKGLAGARNRGISLNTADYMCFVDADDMIEPRYVELLLQIAIEKEVKLSCCNHYIVRKKKKKASFSKTHGTEIILDEKEAYEQILYHGIPNVSAWGKMYHKSLFEGISYPEGKLYEDTFRIGEIIHAAGKLAYTPIPLYHYIIRDNSISQHKYEPGQEDYIEAVNHMIGMIEKYCPTIQCEGFNRRKMHALLSLRRILVDSDPKYLNRKEELDQEIRHNMRQVLEDPNLPIRDKIALWAIKGGDRVFDSLWKAYERLN